MHELEMAHKHIGKHMHALSCTRSHTPTHPHPHPQLYTGHEAITFSQYNFVADAV